MSIVADVSVARHDGRADEPAQAGERAARIEESPAQRAKAGSPSRWRSHRVRRPGHPNGGGQPWVRVPPDPRYPRKKLSERQERRDKWWRRDAHIAIDECLDHGEMSTSVATVLRAALSFSDDQGQTIWAGQKAIGQRMGGRSDRTARRWIRMAEKLGFIEVEHRSERIEGGRRRQLTNLTRVILPAAVEARRVERKANSRGKGQPTPRAPQNGGGGVGERPITLDPRRQQRAAEAVAAPDDSLISAEIGPPGLRERIARLKRATSRGP